MTDRRLAHSLVEEVRRPVQHAAPFRKEPLWHLLAQVFAAAIVSTIFIYAALVLLTAMAVPA